MNTLERRIIELSYKHKLTHISSCLNCVNVIDNIYVTKRPEEPFCMGNGHASLALYVVLERHGMCDAEEMIKEYGVHASRDMLHGVWVSCGSLGQSETVSVGLALADSKRTVWLVTSDGSCMEGATWEALRYGKKYCPNLNVTIIFNGYGAYSKITYSELPTGFTVHTVDQCYYPLWLRGLPGHYLQLNEEQYLELMR